MSTRKKKMFIIKTVGLMSLLIVILFATFQASKIKPASSTVANEKRDFLKTFQDVKLIEQEISVKLKNPKDTETENFKDMGKEISQEEKSLLKDLGIVEEIIPNFKRYTAKELLTSGFFSTFTATKEQEDFLDLYGDEEYFINLDSQMVVLKNGREIDGVLTHQRPIDDDKATESNDVYPKFTLVKLDSLKLKVTLKYPDDSASNQYKINDEEQWHDYNNPITIDENVIIKTRYKTSASSSEYVTGNSKIISDLRLSKPKYTITKTNEKVTTSFGEEIDGVIIKFEKANSLSDIKFRYSYSLNQSEFSDEMEGDSFDIKDVGNYVIKLRAVIEDKNINDSLEQNILFTYDGNQMYTDEKELSNNNKLSSLSIKTNANDYLDLYGDEIDQLNKGEMLTKEVSKNTTQVAIKAIPEDISSVVIGNITHLMSSDESIYTIRIIAENGDSKQVSICIKKTEEKIDDSSYGGYSYGYTGGGGGSMGESTSENTSHGASCIGDLYHITAEGVQESHKLEYDRLESEDYHIKKCTVCDFYTHQKHFYDFYSTNYRLEKDNNGNLVHVHICGGCENEIKSKVINTVMDRIYHVTQCENCKIASTGLTKDGMIPNGLIRYQKVHHTWKADKYGGFYTNCKYLECVEGVESNYLAGDYDQIKCDLVDGHKWVQTYPDDKGNFFFYCTKCKTTLKGKKSEEPLTKYAIYDAPNVKKENVYIYN